MNRYITYLDYFATGEGTTVELALVHAKNKKDAVKQHLDLFEYKGIGDRKYFGKGVTVMKPTSETAKKLFAGMFDNGEKMLQSLANACGAEFKFKYYANFA